MTTFNHILTQLKALLSNEDSTLLNKKHSGGKNNLTGNQFEERYLLKLIFYFLNLCIKNNQYKAKNINICRQVPNTFIDDIGIFINQLDEVYLYQLKNYTQSKLKWNEQLIREFKTQIDYLDKLKTTVYKLFLVHSNDSSHQDLINNKPIESQNHIEVELYKSDNFQVSSFIKKHDDVIDCLNKICCTDSVSHKETIILAFISAISLLEVGQPISLTKVYELAKTQQPSFLIPLDCLESTVTNSDLIVNECKVILDQIDGFKYSLETCFFAWNYLDMLRGKLPYDCTDERFLKFQHTIIENKPKNFDELELLICRAMFGVDNG